MEFVAVPLSSGQRSSTFYWVHANANCSVSEAVQVGAAFGFAGKAVAGDTFAETTGRTVILRTNFLANGAQAFTKASLLSTTLALMVPAGALAEVVKCHA